MRSLTTALVAVALAGCAATPTVPTATESVPAKLQPAGEKLVMVVPASGVQVYECRAKTGGDAEWAFVAPEADLYDTRGTRIGKHYAGPHWEALDGSKVVATVRERADSPSPEAIAWLLLNAKAVGSPAGSFSHVTSIQRVNTVGGMAPRAGCTLAAVGQRAKVAYRADYVFFTR